MYFAQHYLDCLSQAAYVISDETTGRAVVVDPRRDTAAYTADAEAHGFEVTAVINTHFHADFLAGHLELAARTGAWIGYGSRAETEYPVRHLADGESVSLGEVRLQVLHTPGHTPESISLLVFEHADDETPYGVLTGDALFVGDVGRPDLLASQGLSAEELAAMLYDSVHRRLLALPDQVRVFPAHGAGSACGRNLSTERQSTIGEQRATNPACAPMSEDAFVALVTAGQPAAPGYFAYDADLNRRARALFAEADHPAAALDAAALARHRAAGVLVLDARSPEEFAAGHLPGSLNTPADGRFAELVGTVAAPAEPVAVIAPRGRGPELLTRLARIGYDLAVGYTEDADALPGEELRRADRWTVADLAARPDVTVLDVRGSAEREDAGAIPSSLHIPLPELPSRLGELPDGPVLVHCAGGLRSSVAASVLRRGRATPVADLLGGYSAWAESL